MAGRFEGIQSLRERKAWKPRHETDGLVVPPVRKQRGDRKRNQAVKTQGLACDLFPPEGFYFLKVPQPSKNSSTDKKPSVQTHEL